MKPDLAASPPEEDTSYPRGISPVSDGVHHRQWWLIAAFLVVMAALALWSLTRAGHVTGPRVPAARPPRAAPALERPSWLTSIVSVAAPAPMHAEPAGVPPLPPAPVDLSARRPASAPVPRAAHALAPLLLVNLPAEAPAAAAPASSPAATRLPEGNPDAAAPPGQHNGMTPAEAFAERSRLFAREAASEPIAETRARRIDLDWRVASGKLIHGVLETAIQSDLPGPLRAIVSEPVYGESGAHRLIEPGSRLVGEYRAGLALGQSRIFVIWKRLLQPNGISVSIGSEGTDALGRAGLGGDLDRHFLQRFATATLLSLIGSATTAVQANDSVVVNTAQGFGQVAQSAFQDLENLPPTVNVDQGTGIIVFVQRDLDFSPLADASP